MKSLNDVVTSSGWKAMADSMKSFNEMAASPSMKLAAESLTRLNEVLVDSPGMKSIAESMRQLNEMATQSGVTQVAESMKRLGEIAQLSTKPVQIPALDTTLLHDFERPEVRLLREVHGELEGMAILLARGAEQTAAMAEVTRANLTLMNAVVGELQQSRAASDRWNRTITALTFALLAATAVAAVAVVPEFIQQLTRLWSWVQTLH